MGVEGTIHELCMHGIPGGTINGILWRLFIKLSISYQVAKKQGVATDMTTLLALSEKADNDIRSCLNTLQVRLN